MLRAVDQLELCLEHDRAGALGPNERAGDMKPVFGQQFVEVVAGHPPRNLAGIAHGSRSAYRSRSVAKSRIDLSTPAARANDRIDAGTSVAPTVRRVPSYSRMLQLFDVVHGLAGEQRMRAARVVADHAAERATAVRRGSGPNVRRWASAAFRSESRTTPGCTRAKRLDRIESRESDSCTS